MKSKVKYVKLIFEKGSVIFRRVNSYTICYKNSLMTFTFQDKTACVVDMMFLNACMGKMLSIKDNIYNKEVEKLDISCDL